MIHLTIQQLSSFLDGEASESSRSLVQDHLAVCDACSSKFARLEHQEEALVKALTSDPDDAFFERFDRQLADRIAPRPSKVEPVTATVPRARPGGVTAKKILLDRDPDPDGGLFDAAMAAARAPRPKKSAFPWAAAITVFVIVGSIGAVNFGAEYASRWLNGSRSGDVRPANNGPGPIVESADLGSAADPGATAPGGVAGPITGYGAPGAVPSQGVVATPSAPQSGAMAANGSAAPETSAPARVQRAPFPSSQPEHASVPQNDARDSREPAWKPDPEETTEGEEPSAEVDVQEATARYEATAVKLERSLPMLQGDAYRVARYQLAEAWYNAWRLEPNGQRATVLVRAVRAYLIGAPAGAERDTAAGWLTEVESAGY